MRSISVKTTKKSGKTVPKKCSNIKKKKITELKQPIRDTISETISFVIKGKLTPIQPVVFQKKFDIVGKSNKKNSLCDKTTKNKNEVKPRVIKKTQKQPPKIKSKCHSETQEKAVNTTRKNVDKKMFETQIETPNETIKNSHKTDVTKKKKAALKIEKLNKEVKKTKTKNPTNKSNSQKIKIKKEKLQEISHVTVIDELKKQQTIDELLKQVNEEILDNKKTIKAKKAKLKGAEMKSKKKQENIIGEGNLVKIKNELPSGKNTPTELPSLTVTETADIKLSTKIKVEPSSDKEDLDMKPINERIQQHELVETSQRKSKIKPSKQKPEKKKDEIVKVSPVKKKCHKKLKTKPKMTIMKKRIMSSNSRDDDEKKCKTKLFGFWNGPKRHRVASLNALAKVHCLYENETRGNMLDIIDEASKLAYAPRKDPKTSKLVKIKKEKNEDEDDVDEDREPSPLPTRTLRSVPGLRGAGKHWDMHDTSTSSDDLSDDESVKHSAKYMKPEKQTKQTDKEGQIEGKPKKPKKRCRKQTETVMDLKDMVVRKRMASLNASAILAASYSLEKRQSKTMKSDDTDSYEGSSEEYFAASDSDINIKHEDGIKKEDDKKLIEVHTAPNKNVAVILNQDTDVTITGVYVNSTTRSTHHEGFCSIAGMQYRISATSHTQTAATAVATETLLQSSSASTHDNVSEVILNV